MTAENVKQVQASIPATNDACGPPEPWPTDTVERSVELSRRKPRLVAERDWGRRALVRFIQDVETAAPFDETTTRYRTGTRMRLWQCGRKGQPVDRRFWQTSFDIDTMHFIPAEAVEILQIMEDSPPFRPAPFNG
jgi:hypothetical protein